MPEKLRIIVGGLAGRYMLGGPAWDYFHYLLALEELGHEVYYFEDSNQWPDHPISGYAAADASPTLEFFRKFFARHAPGLADRWCYVLLRKDYFGMTREAFDEVAATADVFLNVSGACYVPDSLGPNCRKVFLDTDPGYNQILMATQPDWADNVAGWAKNIRDRYDVHLTYAENLGQDDCLVPTCDLDWHTTRPVVHLPSWKQVRETDPPKASPFTTVMGWSYFNGPVVWNDVMYHQKTPEFEKFKTLPSRFPLLEMAVTGTRYDPAEIRELGWNFVRGLTISTTAEAYRDYITCSLGEWSIAKNVFVAMRTGWFSCRTACYLAGGRPAVVQDTGWSKFMPAGAGCFAFNTMDEAVANLETIIADYQTHRDAAYDFAREHLAADRVIPPMLEAMHG